MQTARARPRAPRRQPVLNQTLFRQYRPQIIPRSVHQDFGSGIPYYDEELGFVNRGAHNDTVRFLSNAFSSIAGAQGLSFLTDHPVWYAGRLRGERKIYGPDVVLAWTDEPASVTADDVFLAVEVVSIHDRRKEEKDTVFMKDLHERHGVPEFLLYFPELSDERSLEWYCLVPGEQARGAYEELLPGNDGWIESRVMPGLAMRVLPPLEWSAGHKVEIRYDGEVFGDYEDERLARRRAEERIRELERELRKG